MGALLAVAVVAVLFTLSLRTPVQPAEATAALAAVETCYSGEATIAHQLGEPDPNRLPLHVWILSAAAGGDPGRVSILAARAASFLALLVAAVAAAAAFGRWQVSTVFLILWTPGLWAEATRGTPGALLAALMILGLAAHEAGRRLNAPSLRWALPPILGAVASLVWRPAVFFIGLALLVEALRRPRSREVSWSRLSAGAIAAVAVIGAWRMAYAGFAADSTGWWTAAIRDLWGGDAVLASRSVGERMVTVALAWLPALVLLVARKPSREDGSEPRRSIGKGTMVAVSAVAALALFAPGVPPALLLPATALAIAVAAIESRRRARTALLVAMPLLIAAIVLHMPHRSARLDPNALDGIVEDDVVVIDREIDVRDVWEIVKHLGRPGRRAAASGSSAAFIGHAEVGPGIVVERPENPEGWSLLARPLLRPELPDDTREDFEAKLVAAETEYAANPSDALSSIWVGRRIAYLGRYRDAIEHYGAALLVHPNDSRLWRHRGHRFISVRRLDEAIADLERAAELEQGREDRVEPDGLPNAAGIPTSTTQTNIWYHLGLAYYLKGDLDQTVRCYREYLARSKNDDSRVAGTHWLHIALRRLGRDGEAAELLAALHDDMQILENHSYHDLALLYAGRLTAVELQERLDRGNGPGQAALAYGLARWYEDTGEIERAREAYRHIVAAAGWAAFGTIAAEAELARELVRSRPLW